jgi:uncharacterized protein (AIM24 family)
MDAFDDEERRVASHLGRASEALKGDRLDEAEKEVTAALAIRSEDLRARNLIGLIHFRAHRYDAARGVYLELAKKYPDDASLRMNLGLVELRMERYPDAVTNLRRVVELEPQNARAQGYLGVALVRTGDLTGAKSAFERGQQPELARQVDDRLSQTDDAMSARGELRKAAGEGAKAVDGSQPFGAVELESPAEEAKRGGPWQLRMPGEQPPLPGPEGAAGMGVPLYLAAPKSVATFATQRLLSAGDQPFVLVEGGMLVVRVDGRLPTRTFGAIASTGTLTFEPLFRRVRAQATEEPFGEGAEAMFVAVGKGLMVVSPRGGRFTALSLADDILYLREGCVYAFEDTLHWENGRVPGSKPRTDETAPATDDTARVTQFRGQGRVVMRTLRETYTLKIEPDSSLYVDGGALAGWIGRVVPRQLQGEGGEPTPYVECSGEGVLILEEPLP